MIDLKSLSLIIPFRDFSKGRPLTPPTLVNEPIQIHWEEDPMTEVTSSFVANPIAYRSVGLDE